jgi:predicted RNase H-like HicB family nuclease
MIEYHAEYYEGEDGWVVAAVVDYPGVLSQGRNLKQAQMMIRDALRLMAEVDIEESRPLPKPRRRVGRKKVLHAEAIPLRIRVQTASKP